MRMQDMVQQQAADAAAGRAPQVVHATFWLWPEHQAALRLWGAVSTQWREGFSGPTGLDYAAVEAVMRLQGMPRAERAERFAELRIMERITLRVWAFRRQQHQQRGQPRAVMG